MSSSRCAPPAPIAVDSSVDQMHIAGRGICEVLVMRHRDDGAALLCGKIGKNALHDFTVAHVEISGRLVGENQPPALVASARATATR